MRPGTRLGPSRFAPTVAAAAAIALVPANADAHRHRFEPTDLEWEPTGMVELDLEVGAIRGADSYRTAAPDFEVDIGILPNVELDIDGAYNVEGPADGALSLDHASPDNLWMAAKLGIYDERDDDDKTGWALGAQLGPKLPVASGARGVGYEGLLLVGRTWRENHLVLNVGGLVDPGAEIGAKRPAGVEAGIDVDMQLGRSPLSVVGELGGLHFFTPEKDQLHGTAGLVFAAGDMLDFSVIGLVGLLRGGDRGGVLFGVSPKVALWK